MGKVATFAERMQQLLDLKGISKAELSRRTGLSRSSITRYVKGDWEGKQDAVYSIASAMDINEAWLMGYDVPMDRFAQPEVPFVDDAQESVSKYINGFYDYVSAWVDDCKEKDFGLIEALHLMNKPLTQLRDDFIAKNPEGRIFMMKNFGDRRIADMICRLESGSTHRRSHTHRVSSYNNMDMDLLILIEKVIRLSPKEREALSSVISAIRAAK